MNTTTALTVLAAEAHHVVNELIMPAWAIGVGMFLLLLLLLVATMSLRSVSQRYEAPIPNAHQGHAGFAGNAQAGRGGHQGGSGAHQSTGHGAGGSHQAHR